MGIMVLLLLAGIIGGIIVMRLLVRDRRSAAPTSRPSQGFGFRLLGDDTSKRRPQRRTEPGPVRQDARAEIERFLRALAKRKTPGTIIVLDLETNGFKPPASVVSCSAIKYLIEPSALSMTELDRFDRYYRCEEPSDPSAVNVHGLTPEEIERRRANATYPIYFKDDDGIVSFCKRTRHFVIHNVEFERAFLPDLLEGKTRFCTMKTNADIVAAEWLAWKGEYKWPTLQETANYYGVAFDAAAAHTSMADVEVTAGVFRAMMECAKQSGPLFG